MKEVDKTDREERDRLKLSHITIQSHHFKLFSNKANLSVQIGVNKKIIKIHEIFQFFFAAKLPSTLNYMKIKNVRKFYRKLIHTGITKNFNQIYIKSEEKIIRYSFSNKNIHNSQRSFKFTKYSNY